jgi:hypothetical protein
MILEAIYEPWFEAANKNFGFRKKKSCHDAIQQIKTHGQACSSAIEGDIVGAFDNVDHDILMRTLSKTITDTKFLNLIKKGLKSGLLDQGKFYNTTIGTPQGGIASPILFNIYMHQFDLDIDQIINDLKKVETHVLPKFNSSGQFGTYDDVRRKIRTFQTRIRRADNTAESDKLFKSRTLLKQEAQQQLPLLQEEVVKLRSKANNPMHATFRYIYVRYADDWIIITTANKKFCTLLKNKIALYLKENLKLELSPEKTLVTDITSTTAQFLGFSIWRKAYKRMRVLTITTGR